MIDWMVIDFILKEKIILKIYKTLKRPDIECCTHAWISVLSHGENEKSDKNNKKSKGLQWHGEIRGIKISNFTGKK